MVPTIVIPQEARQTGICPPRLTAEALKHLHHSGIVILANAVDTAHLDALNAVLTPDAAALAKAPGQNFNFGAHTGNINQGPLLDDSFMFSDVWVNPFALSILTAILGPDPILHYACGNTALQASPTGRQPVHSDIEFAHPRFPFSFVVNIPLVDMTEDNGATEVWPGSHVTTSFDDQVLTPGQVGDLPVRAIIPALVKGRRAISPPAQTCAPKGSIIIRDLRLWHAGRPNLTPTPRAMLAFVWQAAWWHGRGMVRLPLAAQATVKAWEEQAAIPFRIAVRWVDGPVDQQVNEIKGDDTSLASSDAALLEMFSRV